MTPEQGAQLWDEAAEEAVLGAVMLSATAADLSLAALTTGHFHKPRNQEIWEAIQEAKRAGMPIDPIVVAARLRERGSLDRAGGISMLTKLVADVPSVSNVAWYVAIVADLARRRQAILLYQAWIRRASDLTVTFEPTEAFGQAAAARARFSGGVDV